MYILVTEAPEESNTPKANNPERDVDGVHEPLNPDLAAPSIDQEENDVTRLEPSAPPADDPSNPVAYLPRYERVASQPAELSPGSPVLHGPQHQLFRSESDNYEERRHLSVIPEPPPAYDEHREHRLYEPEINNADRAVNWL